MLTVEMELRRIALEGLVDVRTIERFLSGGRVRALSEERIQRACATLGLTVQQLRRARIRRGNGA